MSLLPNSDNVENLPSSGIPTDAPINAPIDEELSNFDIDELLKVGVEAQFIIVQEQTEEPPVLHISDNELSQCNTVPDQAQVQEPQTQALQSKQPNKRAPKRCVTIEVPNTGASTSTGPRSSKNKKGHSVSKKGSTHSSCSATKKPLNKIECIPLASLLPLQMYSEMLNETKRATTNAKSTFIKCDEVDQKLDVQLAQVHQIETEILKLQKQRDGIMAEVGRERVYNQDLRKKAEIDLQKSTQLQETVSVVYERWRQELDAAFQMNVD